MLKDVLEMKLKDLVLAAEEDEQFEEELAGCGINIEGSGSATGTCGTAVDDLTS